MIEVCHLQLEPIAALVPDINETYQRIAHRGDLVTAVEVFHTPWTWDRQGLSYSKVAEVDSDDEGVAFEKTNHIDCAWETNPGVRPLSGCRRRSTSVGDILVRDGVERLVSRDGTFTELPRAALPLGLIRTDADGGVADDETPDRPRG